MQGFTKEYIELRQDNIGVNYTGKLWFVQQKYTNLFSGKKDLLEYEIQEWKLFIDNTGDMSEAEVKIVFRRSGFNHRDHLDIFRKIEYHLLGIFLQQSVLIGVGFLTFMFEVTNFTVSP